MKPRIVTSLLIAGLTAALLASPLESTAAVVRLPDISVPAVPAGGNGFSAYMDVTVENDQPGLTLSAFQLQLLLPDLPNHDIVFSGVSNTIDHPPLLANQPFSESQINSYTLLALKTTFAPEPLLNGGGLARVRFDILAGVEGTYPITLVTIAQDPAFGTDLISGGFAPIPFTTVNGSINVFVPEPAVGVVVTGMAVISRRRRRVS